MTVHIAKSAQLTANRRLGTGLVLIFIGLCLVYAVGLSNLAVAHNTAHDTRHAIGFPCH
ncbi:CbtB-domain containing protein [Aestuariivirga sp.]|jgi:cobalt transporter subunit CbtB|uniref:CbtB domain-containing protein n=1 Tax=Aestuariivirga sp. TaxID=2650926 RepID=UPI0037850069